MYSKIFLRASRLTLLAFLLCTVIGFSSTHPYGGTPVSDPEPFAVTVDTAKLLACEPCEGQLTVLLEGREQMNKSCLDYSNSWVYFRSGNSAHLDSANFHSLRAQRNGKGGYKSWLPISAACIGGELQVKIKKYPPSDDYCDYGCFDYDVTISTGGDYYVSRICSSVPESGFSVFHLGTLTVDESSPTLRTCKIGLLDLYCSITCSE